MHKVYNKKLIFETNISEDILWKIDKKLLSQENLCRKSFSDNVE